MQRLFMETTGISSSQSCGEIMGILAHAGATQINQMLRDREVVGIRFTIEDAHQGMLAFTLPVRTDAIFKVLNSRRPLKRRDEPGNVEKDKSQALRVAWRQIYRWVHAQVAFIETGMVSTKEVFAPYMLVTENKTLFDLLEQHGSRLLLPAGRHSK